jgi:hypothetical protein
MKKVLLVSGKGGALESEGPRVVTVILEFSRR